MTTALDIAMQRADALEVIPPITNPMGKGWDQPDRREILIDEACACMTRRSFDQLAEYSASFPTGVYEGKMWKCRARGTPDWFLVWFGPHLDPMKVSNNYRKILIVEGEPPK